MRHVSLFVEGREGMDTKHHSCLIQLPLFHGMAAFPLCMHSLQYAFPLNSKQWKGERNELLDSPSPQETQHTQERTCRNNGKYTYTFLFRNRFKCLCCIAEHVFYLFICPFLSNDTQSVEYSFRHGS